jgi:hypothetical protein
MMEPEPAAAPDNESGAPEAEEQSAPPVAPVPEAPAAEAPSEAAPAKSLDPPPPPDTPRWMETPPPTPAPAAPVDAAPEVAAVAPVEAPVAPPVEAPRVPAVEAVPSEPVPPEPVFEAVPEPPAPVFDPVPAPPAPEVPAPPVFQAEPEPAAAPAFAAEPPAPGFESAPAVEEAPAAPPAFAADPVPAAPEPVEPAAPMVDPAFARADQPAPDVPDQGWGVAQAPSFTPEAPPVEAQAVPASFGDPLPVPPPPPAPPAPVEAPAEVDSQAFATELDPIAPPEPEYPAAPTQPLATVIPFDVDGKWTAGGRNRMGSGARAPKEAGEKASRGLRLKRSKGESGLEVVPPLPAADVPADVAVPPVPTDALVEEAPAKRKRGLGKEISFGRKKKKKDDVPVPPGGFDAAPVAAAPPAGDAGFGGAGFGAAPVPPAAPVADASVGFGDVAPPPPPPPVAPPPAGGSNAGFGTDSGFGSNAGFGTDPGFGGQSGFGPAPAAEGWTEPIPEKKRRLRLPSSSRGGDSNKKMWSIVLVVALAAAAVGFYFTRGGGGAQPAYALDLAAGQTYTYKTTIAMNAKMSFLGHTVPVDSQLTATMTWRVQAVDPSGIADVDVQLSDVHETVNGQSVPAGQIPASELHSTMRIAKDGSIVSGSGFGSIGGVSGAGSNVPGTDQLAPLLPGHDVHPGNTWSKTYDSNLPYGMGHVHYKTHSTYVRNEDVSGVSAAVIETKMSVPLNMKMDLAQVLQQSGEAGQLPAGAHPVVTYRGRVGGTSTGWFDPNSRQLLKTSAEVNMDFTMVFHGMPGGSVPNGTTMTLRGGMLVDMQKA